MYSMLFYGHHEYESKIPRIFLKNQEILDFPKIRILNV